MYCSNIKKINSQVKKPHSNKFYFRNSVFFYILTLLLVLQGCVEVSNSYDSMAPGIWRGILYLEKGANISTIEADGPTRSLDAIEPGTLPFNFEISYDEQGKLVMTILNAEERIVVNDIRYGRDKATAKDTVLIEFPEFDSYIKAIVNESILQGEWVVNYRENYSIPFIAYHGQSHRFTTGTSKTTLDMTGTWQCDFEIDLPESYPALGEFKQIGNNLTGTFRTETGDYRYLEGIVQDQKFYLSTFDGAHAFLFEGKVAGDGSILGSFRSGSHYKTLWSAERSDTTLLADPRKLTHLKPGYDRFDFSFPSLDGSMVSINDEKYKDKIKIITLAGTWCPNCKDEALFLSNYISQHPGLDIEVIGIYFEKYKEQEKAIQQLKRYREKMNISYTILYGGISDIAYASNALPMLNKIMSYPTMIVVDRDNQVVEIYTGFNGPATSEYEQFTKDFDELMKRL